MRALSSSMLLLSASALALSGPVVLPVAAHGAGPTWEPTRVLAAHPRGASLMVDAQGDAMVAWVTSTGRVKVVRRPFGGTWGVPKVIGRTRDPVSAPQIAADRAGNVTVVWAAQRRGFTDGVLAARHPKGGHWSTPVRLSDDLRVAGYPGDGRGPWGASSVRLAMSPRGAVVVAWDWGSDDRGKPWRIQSVYRPPGGPWSDVAHVTANGAREPSLGIAGDGSATLLYSRQPMGHPQSLLSRVRRPGHGWSDPSVVTHRGYGPHLAVDRAGNAVVAFTPDLNRVMASYRPARGHWRPPQRLTPKGVRADQVSALAMNPRGTAVVVWPRASGRVDLVRRPAHGKWSAPELVADTPDLISQVSVALDPSGDAFVAWGDYGLYGAYQPRNHAWGSPMTLSPESDVDVLESLESAMSPGGAVAVLWKQEAMPLKVRIADGG